MSGFRPFAIALLLLAMTVVPLSVQSQDGRTSRVERVHLLEINRQLKNYGGTIEFVDPSLDPRWTPGAKRVTLVDEDGQVTILTSTRPPSSIEIHEEMEFLKKIRTMVVHHGAPALHRASHSLRTQSFSSAKDFLTQLDRRADTFSTNVNHTDDGNSNPYQMSPSLTEEGRAEFEKKLSRYGAKLVEVADDDERLKTPGRPHTTMAEDGTLSVLVPKGVELTEYHMIDQLSHVVKLADMTEEYGVKTVADIIQSGAEEAYLSMDLLRSWEIKAKQRILQGMKSNNANRKSLLQHLKQLRWAADPMAKFRLPNNRLNWKAVRKHVSEQGNSLGRYMLALFLKELAVALKTGDRILIEEFFDNMLTFDFFSTYFFYTAGVIGTELVYTRLAEKFIRPRFVSTVLKSSLAVAVGTALPDIVRGKFDGRVFVVNLTGLFVSSAALKTGMAGLKWVLPVQKILTKAPWLKKVFTTSKVLAKGAKAAGWIYQVAEVAVVVYVGDAVSRAVNKYLDERAAKKKVGRASEDLVNTLNSGDEDKVEMAMEKVEEAYGDYRKFLYRDLNRIEQELMKRLNSVGRDLQAGRESRRRYLELYHQDPVKYASLKGIADKMEREKINSMEKKMAEIFDIYQKKRDKALDELYQDGVRGSSLVDHDWETARTLRNNDRPRGLLDRAVDAWKERSIRKSFYKPSANRLESYRDEQDLLKLALAMTTSGEVRKKLHHRIDELTALREMDQTLYRSLSKPRKTEPSQPENTRGLIDPLKRSTDDR